VSVKRKNKILLSTHKPQYQPSHFIDKRALSLSAGDLKPATDASLTVALRAGKGRRVFKDVQETDASGLAAARFPLASDVNLGTYTVRAILGDDQSEKVVTVDRYVLPTFEIEISTDREFYQPGDTLTGEIQSDYFFGKPVAGGQVTVKAST